MGSMAHHIYSSTMDPSWGKPFGLWGRWPMAGPMASYELWLVLKHDTPDTMQLDDLDTHRILLKLKHLK